MTVLLALLAFGLAPTLLALEGYAAAAANYLMANPSIDAGVALWVLVSIANKLQSNPKTAGNPVAFALRKLVDIVSFLPHADARGVFGGILQKYLAPGVAQNVLQLLFGWYNLPVVPSTPKADAPDVPAAAPAPRGYVRLAFVAPVLIAVSLLASCAFLQSIKSKEIDCADQALTAAKEQLIPQVTILLSTGGVSWPTALAVLEKDAGDALLCAVGVVVSALEGKGAPAAAPPVTALVRAEPTATTAPDKSLALFCALSEGQAVSVPPDCAALTAEARAYGRGKAFLNERGLKVASP